MSETVANLQMTGSNKGEKGKPPRAGKPRGQRDNRGGGKKQGK